MCLIYLCLFVIFINALLADVHSCDNGFLQYLVCSSVTMTWVHFSIINTAVTGRCSSDFRLSVSSLSFICPLSTSWSSAVFTLTCQASCLLCSVFLLGRLPFVCGHILEQLVSSFVEPFITFIVFVNLDANFLFKILPFADRCLSVEHFNFLFKYCFSYLVTDCLLGQLMQLFTFFHFFDFDFPVLPIFPVCILFEDVCKLVRGTPSLQSPSTTWPACNVSWSSLSLCMSFFRNSLTSLSLTFRNFRVFCFWCCSTTIF